jgi:hypothetical protein
MTTSSNFDRYRGMHVSEPRRSHGSNGTHVIITTGIDRRPPSSYTDPNSGKTYRPVNYGTLGGGTLYVESPNWDRSLLAEG